MTHQLPAHLNESEFFFSDRRKRARLKKAALRHQRGVSLFIVLIILLLSLIVALGGLAVANLNESIVGNQSDSQRAFGATEALLDAAQRDIRLNGRECDAAALGSSGVNATFQAGQRVSCTLRYPRDMADYMEMVTNGDIVGGASKCSTQTAFAGVCISGDPSNTQFNTSGVKLNGSTQPWTNGANYRTLLSNADSTDDADFGGSAVAGSGASAASLALTGQAGGTPRGQYWVEIFPYSVSSLALNVSGTIQNAPIPDGTYPFVFRITAIARGLKSSTVSVLRTYYVPYPMAAVQ
jgi:type IV pilus assembly protein PilX